jgi:catechol 2,3-dioxygenase-like lactoylglutathione lyase family enzyme
MTAASTEQPVRRPGATAVHSLDRFVFSVPDLTAAADFYAAFGLDVRAGERRIDLYTFGHPHCWGTIHQGSGPKQLEYLRFAAYPEDFDAIVARCERNGVRTIPAHRLADGEGVFIADPDGTPLQIAVGERSAPLSKPARGAVAATPAGKGAAPSRSAVKPVRPRRLSHVLLFSTDVPRSARFYADALGMRLSDWSGDLIAFMHGAHASDHHMLAFAKSDGPGLHHSSWDVASLDDVGLGMQQMLDRGHTEGWGVGRHVLGSNYFRYIRDPWGSFAEYSYDIDFIPADVEWQAADHPPADSFYVWGPPVPDYFIVNHETAARRAKAA